MKAWLVAVAFVLAGSATADDVVIKEEAEWSGPGWYIVSVDEWNSAPMIDGFTFPRSKLLDAGPFGNETTCKANLPKIPVGQMSEFTTACERLDTKPDCKASEWDYHCRITAERKEP